VNEAILDVATVSDKFQERKIRKIENPKSEKPIPMEAFSDFKLRISDLYKLVHNTPSPASPRKRDLTEN